MVLQRDHVYFAIILLCVPIQYFAVNYMGSTETSRNYAISTMVTCKDIFHKLTCTSRMIITRLEHLTFTVNDLPCANSSEELANIIPCYPVLIIWILV